MKRGKEAKLQKESKVKAQRPFFFPPVIFLLWSQPGHIADLALNFSSTENIFFVQLYHRRFCFNHVSGWYGIVLCGLGWIVISPLCADGVVRTAVPLHPFPKRQRKKTVQEDVRCMWAFVGETMVGDKGGERHMRWQTICLFLLFYSQPRL